MAKCTCPTCDGRGEVVGKYVICEGLYATVLAEGETVDDVLSYWTGARSLRFKLAYNDEIVNVTEEDYQRANDLAIKAHRRGTSPSASAPEQRDGEK